MTTRSDQVLAWKHRRRAAGICVACPRPSGKYWKCAQCRLADAAKRRAKREAV